jgi:histidinol dehydrogenase
MAIQIPDKLDWSSINEEQRQKTLSRPPLPVAGFGERVAEIIASVREEGDRALLRLGEKFDGVRLEDFEVSRDESDQAEAGLEPALRSDMDEAIGRITAFHQAGSPKPVHMSTADGLDCEARYLPMTPVGLYVPGGSAPLISTVIMLAVPAQIAGCKDIVLCSPPDGEGNIHPAILAAASRCGVSRIFKLGGAQAIAAMGLGTKTVPACVKLFGPGNAWVTEAKQQIAALPGGAARDMPAGPSEVLVIADDTADPVSVCWDLLSQAEHGPDSQALLISESTDLLERVGDLLPDMAGSLPRASILAESLQHLRRIRVNDLIEAVRISNRYAPEHLILNCSNAEELVDGITAAGSVFVGPWTPESLGDYCSGTNHVLPTYGYARAYSGLSVNDFMRRMTLQRATPTGLQTAGPCAATLAGAEGLDAHRMAVTYRLDRIAGTS